MFTSLTIICLNGLILVWLVRTYLHRRKIHKELSADATGGVLHEALSPRIAAMQALIAHKRSPEAMEVLTNLGFILEDAATLPASKRPKHIDAMLRQAEAATHTFIALPCSPWARVDYMTRLCELAESLTECAACTDVPKRPSAQMQGNSAPISPLRTA